MDRNGNFDYRNFFYPGPAPLPVQIYPVSGDPRFPFPFPSGAPNMNMARGQSTSSPPPEDIAADETTLDQHASASPPPGSSTLAKRDAASAAGQPTTSAPVKLDHVVQGLTNFLQEAISFCEACLKTHEDVVAVVPFAGHATRNSLWRELLESRFEASGVHKDLLHTLVPRVRRYTQQAQQAVARDAPPEGDGGGDGDSHYRLALLADKMSAECNWVGQLSRKAMGSSAACKSLVETMKEMMVLCGKIGPGGGDAGAQDGGGGQY